MRKEDAGLDPWLTRASLAYLGLPVLLFLLLWLKPGFGFPAAVLSAVGLVGLFRAALSEGIPDRRLILGTLAVAVAAALISGAGGVGLQNWDYDKHNAVLHDLISRPVPIRYADVGDPALAGPLVYYMGWYMPAAVVGRALGWEAANAALFVWTALGLWLALLWFARLAGGRGPWPALFLLFFSGMDAVGAVLQRQNPIRMSNLEFHNWSGLGQYTHNLALVTWVPHHALAMWLATGLLLLALRQRPLLPAATAAWILTPFWTPWVFVGLTPVVVLAWANRNDDRERLTVLRPSSFVLLSSTALPFVLTYLASNRGNVVHGWAWTFSTRLTFLRYYAGFALVEFALVAWLTWRLLRPQGTDRWLLGGAIAALAVLPVYRVGISGDLMMRASLPYLFILAIYAFRALAASEGKWRWALAGVLALGALSPLHEAGYALAHYRLGPPPAETVRPLPFMDGRNYAKQFIGDPNKLFWRRFARE